MSNNPVNETSETLKSFLLSISALPGKGLKDHFSLQASLRTK